MNNEKKLMCDKTQNRIDSVRDNTVDDMKTVDLLIGKSTRKTFEDRGRKHGFKVQFLYSSDLDGWYDEISKIMYLSLSHAMKQSIVECFNREIKKYNLESTKSEENNNKNCNRQKIFPIAFFFTIIVIVNCVALIYGWYDNTLGCLSINGWASIIVLFVIELYVYDDSLQAVNVKKKECTSEPVLGTINMCGGIMDFERLDLKTGLGIYSNYIAFCGIPVIFIGRFLAKEIQTDSWREKRYKVYCQIDTPIRQIYHFYITRIGGMITVVSIIIGVSTLGSHLGL